LLTPIRPRIGLEICVDSAAGLRAAAEHGADRIELCAALSEGGLTPSQGMMQMASKLSKPVRAMIRPRGGNFSYDGSELDIMRRDIEAAAACALEGVVLGCNDESGNLDEAAMGSLVSHAREFGLKVTLHRSFDLVRDPPHALNVAAALRIDTILTSGLQNTAMEGLELIAQLVQLARKTNVQIMAGSGVVPSTAEALITRSGVSFVHASCRRPLSNSCESTARLHMTPHRETDPMLIAQLRRTLDALQDRKPAGVDA
jgi:copper homeostasis protein